MRKVLLLGCWLGVVSVLLPSICQARPNIILLLTDDQQPDTIRALGNEHIITPTLDRLVESGTSIRNVYNQGSFTPAVCLASRAMIVTGQNWERLDVGNRTSRGTFDGKEVKKDLAFPSTPLLGDLLNDAGYYTGALIKLGPTPKAMEGCFTYTRQIDSNEDRLGGFSGRNAVNMALEFLESYDRTKAKEGQRPFFLYIGFPGPHDPRFADKSLLDLYHDLPPLPRNYAPYYPFRNGFSVIGRDESMVPHPRTEQIVRVERLYHYAMITSIDQQIGRLIEALKARGEYENTLIIFSSDHGLSLGSHGLMGKQSLYEEATKVPFVVVGPGVSVGRRSDAFAYLHDVYATICEAAGVPFPLGVHSKSLMPVLRDEQAAHRDEIYLSYTKFRSLRQGDWKIIQYNVVERPSLFNLRDDPDELVDLADFPEHAGRIATLQDALARAVQAHGGEWSRTGKFASKTLEPLSLEDMLRIRQEYDKVHGLQKTARQTEEIRKAKTGLGVWFDQSK